MRMNLVAMSLFIVILFCVSSSAQVRKQRPPTAPIAPTFTPRQIADKAARSLVLILTTDADGEPLSQGSGFFFQPDLVATNLHVLKRAWQGQIQLVSTGVTYRIFEVIGVDIRHDICVLKIDGVSAPALSLNISKCGSLRCGGRQGSALARINSLGLPLPAVDPSKIFK